MISCRVLLVGCAVWLLGTGSPQAESVEPVVAAPVSEQPVTAARGKVADMLRMLERTGRVAGNVGDVYDNRDRGHSRPRLQWFPQLQQIVYSEAEKEAGRDWALATMVRPRVVVGNSSTSGGRDRNGSNPRTLYTNPRGLRLGWLQYIQSNLYIYPEHRDYEPGRYGLNKAGDLFPANSPYLLVSLGSSGSDQQFLHAVFWTLAAFKPDVKQELIDRKLLMPSVQMILRRNLRHVRSREDYLSGRAHTPVFDGDDLDPEAMVRMAHRISKDRLPPIALLRIVEESPSVMGRDYFHPKQSERWAQTPAAISRVYRGPRPYYRMVLDASRSMDVNDRPLTFHWRVLSGDAARIAIEPLNEEGSRVELRVPFHNEPVVVQEDPRIEGRRVDIACFADNDAYLSAPSIVSVYMPPHQRMTVDADDRVVEIGYGAQALALRPPERIEQVLDGSGAVTDWPALLQHLAGDGEAAQALRQTMSKADQRVVEQVVATVSDALVELQERQQRLDAAEEALAEAKAQAKAASEATQAEGAAGPDADGESRGEAADSQDAAAAPAPTAERLRRLQSDRDTVARFVEQTRDRIGRTLFGTGADDDSPSHRLIGVLQRLRDDPKLYVGLQEAVGELIGPARRLRDRLADLHILVERDGRWALDPARPDGAFTDAELTVFVRNQLAAFHEHVLNQLCGGLLRTAEPMPGDPRIALPHVWRDVYRHDPQGRIAGWTRYGDGQVMEFTADGKLRQREGESGEAHQPVPVNYEKGPGDLWNARLIMHPVGEQATDER